MALVYAPAATGAQREPDGAPTQIFHPGNAKALATSAASANTALPVDGNGNPYTTVYLTATQATWVAFCTLGSDSVVVGTAPAFLINPGGPVALAVPNSGVGVPNSTPCGFIAAIATGAGFLSVLGLY